MFVKEGSLPGYQVLDPKDLLIFTETRWFSADWEGLGLNDEEDLTALQLEIMSGPKKHPVVAGTGGLRKMRFAPPGWHVGKRGALRVCYTHYEEFGHVLLVVVYPKGIQETLSPAEKAACRQLIAEHRELLTSVYRDRL